MQGFQCSINTDVESFLTQPTKAIRFEQTDNARTYQVLDESTGDILGYFSVTFKELSLKSTALSKLKSKKWTESAKMLKESVHF